MSTVVFALARKTMPMTNLLIDAIAYLAEGNTFGMTRLAYKRMFLLKDENMMHTILLHKHYCTKTCIARKLTTTLT